jgi:AcrR family transcriptional regulator
MGGRTDLEGQGVQTRRLRPGPGQDPAQVEADQRARLLEAMADLVYELGYQGVTVQKLLARAHVTKPTFYRLFSGKEDCYFGAFAKAAEHALEWTEAATRECTDRRELIERGLAGFGEAVASRPAAVCLVLQEPISVGENAQAQMRRVERRFAELIIRRFGELEHPVELPFSIARGIVMGIEWVARWRLNLHQPTEVRSDVGELAHWVMAISEIESWDGFRSRWDEKPMRATTPGSTVPALAGNDERAMLVNTAIRLFTERGYDALDANEIAAAAGLSKRRFDEHFATVADCLSAAVELGAASSIAAGRAAYRAGDPGPSGVARSINALARYLAANPGIARLLFVEIYRPGRRTTKRGAGILSALAGMLCERMLELPRMSAEASVGAIWCSIRYEVEEERMSALPQFVPVLVWLALAPSTGDGGLEIF